MSQLHCSAAFNGKSWQITAQQLSSLTVRSPRRPIIQVCRCKCDRGRARQTQPGDEGLVSKARRRIYIYIPYRMYIRIETVNSGRSIS